MEPTNGTQEGGLVITAKGKGLFDTQAKKIKFQTAFGERLVRFILDRRQLEQGRKELLLLGASAELVLLSLDSTEATSRPRKC